MAVTKQFTVCLENKPGQLAKLCQVLSKGKVNIVAISVAENADCGLVRFVPDNVAAARKALQAAKLSAVTGDVVAVRLADQPGILAAASAKLAKAGVNIRYVYGSTNPACDDALCVFAVDDIKAAAAALG